MGESLDKIVELIENSKVILAMGHQLTDDDSLFSTLFLKKYIEKHYTDKKCTALIESEEALSDPLTNVVTKYKDFGVHHVTDPLTETPDLIVLLDAQIGKSNLLVPTIKQDEEVSSLEMDRIKKICLDHHTTNGNNGYDFCLIDGTKYNSTTSLIIDVFGEEKVREILEAEPNQMFASLGYEGIYQDTGGMKKEVMTEADHKAAKFLSQYIDHGKMHLLHRPRKNLHTRKMLGEAFSKEKLDNVEEISNYVFISTQIKKTDDAKLAEVANGILECEESRELGVIVGGIVHDSENDKYTLGFKVRSDKPKNLPADRIAAILWPGVKEEGADEYKEKPGGGDKFKAAASIDLKIFRHSTGSHYFRALIREEVHYKLRGSELNGASEKPSKQTLGKPTDLNKLVEQNRESEHHVGILQDSLNNMVLRSQKKFASYFVDQGITEDDVSALLDVDAQYCRLMGKAELKKTQASFIYGLVNQGSEPYLVGIISVKKDDEKSELDTAEEFSKKLFGPNIQEAVSLEKENKEYNSIIFRVPIPYIEYKTTSQELLDCIKYEVSEREKILGEKEETEVKEVEEE